MGFLAPWFIAGLAVLGVPVFVHLLRRHVTTPRPVSSLMFFERGTQSSTRHRRLKYRLLFALRAALLLLLVLAFANPFVRRSAAHANGRMHLIVLDNSFSMRAATRFADAKRQALAALEARLPGDKMQIMALGGELEILTEPITDDARLRSALDGIQPGDGRASLGDLARGVRSLAETVHGPIVSTSSATCNTAPCRPTLPRWSCQAMPGWYYIPSHQALRFPTGRSRA